MRRPWRRYCATTAARTDVVVASFSDRAVGEFAKYAPDIADRGRY